MKREEVSWPLCGRARNGWAHGEQWPGNRTFFFWEGKVTVTQIAESRRREKSFFDAMSETITRCFKDAAEPHEPTQGPIVNGLMSSIQPLGSRGPAAGQRRMPSASISITAETMLPA